jgi:hypothetical protein
MTTALIYVLTSIALALVMLVLGKIADKPRTDANAYAYPKKAVWLVFGLLARCYISAVYFFGGASNWTRLSDSQSFKEGAEANSLNYTTRGIAGCLKRPAQFKIFPI